MRARIPLIAAMCLGCGADEPRAWMVVGVDASHRNKHTLKGDYEPFGELAETRSGGVGREIRVRGLKRSNRPRLLEDLDVLVVVGVSELVPYREHEASTVEQWVRGGAGLLIVVDHSPYPASTAALTEAFGFDVFDGWLYDPRRGDGLELSREAGSLREHPLLDGPYGEVERIYPNSGSAFVAPDGAEVVATVPVGWRLRSPGDEPGEHDVNVEGMAIIAALEVGKGRVVLMSEASMLSCRKKDGRDEPLGFCEPGHEDQEDLVLNTLDWLGARQGAW